MIELEEGCFNGNIKKITVLPNNKRYLSLRNGKMLIGKSSLKSKIYNIFMFCARDVEHAIIPDDIEIIDEKYLWKYLFYYDFKYFIWMKSVFGI